VREQTMTNAILRNITTQLEEANSRLHRVSMNVSNIHVWVIFILVILAGCVCLGMILSADNLR
jgi:hypothetical protein